jgi:hypothetical protein
MNRHRYSVCPCGEFIFNFFKRDFHPKCLKEYSFTVSNFQDKLKAARMDPHLSFRFETEFGDVIIWPNGRCLHGYFMVYFTPNMKKLKEDYIKVPLITNSNFIIEHCIQFQFRNTTNQCVLFRDAKAVIMASSSHLILQILLDEDLFMQDEIVIHISLTEESILKSP